MKKIIGVLMVMISLSVHAQYCAPPTWLVNSGSSVLLNRQNAVYSTSPNAAWSNGAVSKEWLSSGSTGTILYNVKANAEASDRRAFGFVSQTNMTINQMSAGFIIDPGRVQVQLVYNGSVGIVASLTGVTELRMVSEGGSFKWYINGKLITKKSNQNIPYCAATFLGSPYARMTDVRCSFYNSFPADWAYLDNFEGNSAGIVKQNNNLSSYAVSKNYIPANQNGFFELPFANTSMNGPITIGFDKSIKPCLANDLDLSLRFDILAGVVEFYANALLMKRSFVINGDVVRLESIGDQVVFTVNGNVQFTYVIDNINNRALHVISNASTGSAYLRSLKVSFSYAASAYVFPDKIANNQPVLCSAELFGTNSSTGYYVWSDLFVSGAEYANTMSSFGYQSAIQQMSYEQLMGVTSSSRYAYVPGEATIHGSDASGSSHSASKYTVSVALENPVATSCTYSSSTGIISSTAGSAQFNSTSGVIAGYTDGMMEFTAADMMNSNFICGLKDDDVDIASDGSHIKFGFKNINHQILVLSDAISPILIGPEVEGSIFRIEVIDQDVNYYYNGALVATGKLTLNKIYTVSAYLKSPNKKLNMLGHTFDWLVSPLISKKPKVIHAPCEGGLGYMWYKAPKCYLGAPVFTVYNDQNEIVYSGTDASWWLPPGNYSFSVANPCGLGWSGVFSIGYEVNWEAMTSGLNIPSSDNSDLEDIGLPTLDVGDSKNILDPFDEGWIEWVERRNTNGVIVFGGLGLQDFSELTGWFTFSNWNVASMSNSFGCPPASMMNVYSNNATVSKVFRIEWSNTGIYFKYNGALISSISCPPDQLDLYRMIGIFFGSGDKILNARASFGCRQIFDQYAEVLRELDADYLRVDDNIVRFKFREEYKDSDNQLDYSVYNWSRDVMISGTNTPLSSHFGLNYLNLDVSSLAVGYYVLEVKNTNNEVFKLRFKKN